MALPPAFAVEEMREFNDGGKKAGRTKSCPKGARYSEKKRGCVKTSCAAGQVWSSGTDACVDGRSAALTDEDLYLAAGEFVLEARYADALPLLFRIKDRNTPQVLNLIGYSTRKLGDIDKGIDYYRQALAVDPDYTKARQYLGEAYLLKNDVGKAKEQLDEIADAAAVHARTMSFCGGNRRPCQRRSKRGLVGLLSKHSVRVCGYIRNDLQHVPMLDDLSVVVQENIDARPDVCQSCRQCRTM